MQARITSVGLIIPKSRAEHFEYPHHIDRASLDALPSRPGIYIFRDEDGVALYIGKSVNIRSRVLSHLRAPEEARMLEQTAYIEFERTAGEIGALLLESKLIKQVQPVYNKMLRHAREMCTLRLAPGLAGSKAKPGLPEIVFASEQDFSVSENLYGLFATRRGALETLRAVIEENKLCPALLGLETVARGRACFAHQIGRCLGACVGKEDHHSHFERLRAALDMLRVLVWPHAGAVGIVEESDGWRQTHVVDHWFYVGSLDHNKQRASQHGPLCNHAIARPPMTRKSLQKLSARRHFDADTYKILVRPLLTDTLDVVPFDYATSLK